MKSTQQTRDLASNILDYIYTYPERHDQRNWYTVDGIGMLPTDKAVITENVCNTTMCIAGTAMYLDQGVKGLSKFTDDEIDAEDEAAELLGLDEQEACTLFYEMRHEEALLMLKKISVGEDIVGPFGQRLT